MGKVTSLGLRTGPPSRSSFVLLGGPSKRPPKPNSTDDEPKEESAPRPSSNGQPTSERREPADSSIED